VDTGTLSTSTSTHIYQLSGNFFGFERSLETFGAEKNLVGSGLSMHAYSNMLG
jgi:hypothetical protein